MKKIVFYLVALILVVGCGGPDRSDSLVVIDAGHGGHDTGAIAGGQQEKDLVLQITKKLKKELKRKGYRTISLQELYDLRMGIKEDNSNLCLIHFDDGFLDNYTIAYPMLKNYGFNATVFINPEFVDPRLIKRKQVYDDIKKGYKIDLENTWGYMSWEELKEIDMSGVIDVQGHALTHTWYTVEPKVIDIHHKNDKYFWSRWNDNIEQKPFWLNKYGDLDMKAGYPVFRYAKSISSKKYFVDDGVIEGLFSEFVSNQDLQKKSVRAKIVSDMNRNIDKISEVGFYETDSEYTKRLEDEIQESKIIIQSKLDKQINILINFIYCFTIISH